MPEPKQDLLDAISAACGTPRYVLVPGRGSSEPKQILLDVVATFALPLDTSVSKPALAQAIVELTGGSWDAQFDSRRTPSGGGSTISALGLVAVLKSVHRLVGGGGPMPLRGGAQPLGAAYRAADEHPTIAPRDPFETDPDAVDRASAAHAQTQNALGDWARGRGLVPRSPGTGDPQFDIGWESAGEFVVVEVKSLLGAREDGQIRLGIGQVFDYRRLIGAQTGGPCRAAVAVSRQPRSSRWRPLCEELELHLVWPGEFERLALAV